MRFVFLLGVLCACEATTMPPPIGDSDASSDSPITHTGGSNCGFTPTDFSLPSIAGTSGPALSLLSGSAACSPASGTLDHFLTDIDEDGRLDLVQTSACGDATVGTTRWLVYPGTATAFGAPVSYAIPDEPAGCAAFALADTRGSGALDLVVTSLCNDASVGTTRWLVYANTGGGFSTTPTAFALPNVVAAAFPSMEVDVANCASQKPAFAYFDVDGDGFGDLVVTTACDDATVGVTHWRVYPGSSTGLGAAISFPLPSAGAFPSPFGGTKSCSASPAEPSYALVDLDGDFKLDLLVTASCTDASLGVGKWNVYENDGASFSPAATSIALPSIIGASCSGGASSTLGDVDGDGKLDLIVTRACSDANVGASEWLVFPNQGASFGAEVAYALPSAFGATPTSPITSLSGAMTCSPPAHPAFGAAYLLGGPLDLVVTQSCTDATVGASRWIAYAPACAQN